MHKQVDSVKRKPGRPKSESTIDKDEILNIALTAFAEKGYDGVSITSISKQINVGDSLLHYHFGNKKKLWQATVEKAFVEYEKDSLKAVKLLKDLDQISMSKAMTRHFIHFTGKHPQLYQIIIHEMAKESEQSEWLQKNVMQSLSNRFFQHHKKFVEQGLVEAIPIANLTTIFLGACNTFFTFHLNIKNQYKVNVFDEEEIDKHADIVIKMLYHGMFEK